MRWCAFAASQTVCERGNMKLCLSVALWAWCAGFAPMLSSWLCGVLRGVDSVFFFPFFFTLLFFFCPPPPFLFLPSCTPTCIPHAWVLVLLSPPHPHLPASLLCNSSSLPPRSRLFPHPLPPRPLTDPPPPSLAGTPCRTVWRRSIRQSNPESLPSGRSGDRWVTRGEGWGCRETSSHLGLEHHLVSLLAFQRFYFVKGPILYPFSSPLFKVSHKYALF